MKAYIAGPMSNHPQYNVPAFLDAQKDLDSREDIETQLPVDLNDPKVVEKLLAAETGTEVASGQTWGELLALDLELIEAKCDTIVVLPGWQRSRGARLETFFGRLLDYPILHYPSLRKVRAVDLQIAHGIELS